MNRLSPLAHHRSIIRHPSFIHLSYPGSGSWLGAGQCAARGARWARGSGQGTRRFAEINWSLAVRNARKSFSLLSGLLLADHQTNVKRQYRLCRGTIHLAAILCPVLSTVTRNSRKPFVWSSLPDTETVTAHTHLKLSCSMICAPGPVVFQLPSREHVCFLACGRHQAVLIGREGSRQRLSQTALKAAEGQGTNDSVTKCASAI